MHFLLILSFTLTLISSSFLTLVFENRKIYKGLCIFASVFFAQVVFTYELLSLFSLIKPMFVLTLNLIFFGLFFFLWRKKGKSPDFGAEIREEYLKFRFAMKRDKWLKACFIAFVLCIIGSLFYMYFMPVNDEDAFSYHIARLPFWYNASNLNHFDCADIRALIMPINSEIFYFWAYSFIKSDIFVRFFSVLSYGLFIVALRGFLKELSVPFRLSLWVIFSVSAMQSVMFSIAGAETNIAISALVLGALYLFIVAVKNNEFDSVYFAALLFALAIGTKTPALQVSPSVLLISSVIAFIYKKKEFYKPLLLCFGFIILNFVLFASYNYVLNYLDFGNPISSPNAMELHSFFGGFKGFVANIVRYFAMLIDFSGLPFGVEIWRIKTAIVKLILALCAIDPDIGTITGDMSYFTLGNNFDNMSGLGILSLLLFIPALIVAFKRKRHSKSSIILAVIAFGFLLNILILSFSLGYMIFSIRFIMFFVMIASPILIYGLLPRKNLFKKIIAIIIIYSFTFSYYFYERRFTPYLMYIFYKNPSVEKFKEKIVCANIDFDTDSQACKLIKYVKSDKPVKVLYFAPSGINIYFPKHSENENLKIDFKLLETTDEADIDWQSYDYIVVPNIQQNTNIKNVLKYKNAVIAYNDDIQKGEIFYDFAPNIFANCVFGSNRVVNFKWLKEDENKITASLCYYKRDIFEKHGFSAVEKFDTYDKIPDNQLIVYKNIHK